MRNPPFPPAAPVLVTVNDTTVPVPLPPAITRYAARRLALRSLTSPFPVFHGYATHRARHLQRLARAYLAVADRAVLVTVGRGVEIWVRTTRKVPPRYRPATDATTPAASTSS